MKLSMTSGTVSRQAGSSDVPPPTLGQGEVRQQEHRSQTGEFEFHAGDTWKFCKLLSRGGTSLEYV